MILRILSKDVSLLSKDGKKIKVKKKTEDKNALHFEWKSGLSFFEESIDIRMITKEWKNSNLLENGKVYRIETESGSELLIQAIQGVPNVLSIDDDGILGPKPINELSEEDTLLVFDSFCDGDYDYMYDDIRSVDSWELFSDKIDENEEPNHIKNYMIHVGKHGIVINNLFIC
jgi:hypothetical protein